MDCTTSHQHLHEQSPQLNYCPECGESLQAPTIDLTASSPVAPAAAGSNFTVRPQATTSMSVPAADAHNQPSFTFSEAVSMGVHERTRDNRPRQARIVANDVAIHLFFSQEERIITKSGFPINKVKAIHKGPQMSAISVPISTYHQSHQNLITWMFATWRVDGQYQHTTGWEFVGDVRLGNGQGFVSLALDKSARVRIMDIKRAGGQEVGKEKCTVNIMHRVIEEVEEDEEPAGKKSRGKGKAKATRPAKRQPSPSDSWDDDLDDLPDIPTLMKCRKMFTKPPTGPVRIKREPTTPIKQEKVSKTSVQAHTTPTKPVQALAGPSKAALKSEDVEEAATEPNTPERVLTALTKPAEASMDVGKPGLPPPMLTRAACKKRSHSEMAEGEQ
ncbi:hypothetical protein MGN70_004768 [Eutypa lata]|nr:hypothetical protein MGN70_014297 [Eutypa lata]KAI1250352.1 hypothetical protein MGN70_007405 [Eutypa lata]KAI1253240.1 hypothetical protein MGN70_005448 [Eutypa lata]KAI1254371.1 hypothetical protein MGN70_004768 [Eutypa lata]